MPNGMGIPATFKKKKYNESKYMRIGYARVSTVEQNLDLQLAALKIARCDEIIEDLGLPGTGRDRPGLTKLMEQIGQGDTLVVWRLDRLGRSLIELIDILNQLSDIQANFESVTEAIDTSSSGGRLVFHMLGALAEFERNLISDRTKAGMAVAKSAGKHIGRPRILTNEQIEEAWILVTSGTASVSATAERFGVHPKTLRRALDKRMVDISRSLK